MFLNSVVLNLFGHVYLAVIKTTVLSAISSDGSTFRDTYRYLSYMYNIGSHIWMLSLNKVIKCISLYIFVHEILLYSAQGAYHYILPPPPPPPYEWYLSSGAYLYHLSSLIMRLSYQTHTILFFFRYIILLYFFLQYSYHCSRQTAVK